LNIVYSSEVQGTSATGVGAGNQRSCASSSCNREEGKRDTLTEFDADIEGEQFRDKPVLGNILLEHIGRETKPTE